ncbi:hypothetical protein D3C84_1108330 [compost metagenome]
MSKGCSSAAAVTSPERVTHSTTPSRAVLAMTGSVVGLATMYSMAVLEMTSFSVALVMTSSLAEWVTILMK